MGRPKPGAQPAWRGPYGDTGGALLRMPRRTADCALAWFGQEEHFFLNLGQCLPRATFLRNGGPIAPMYGVCS